MFNILEASEQTMDVLLGEADCPKCGKKTKVEILDDLGMCLQCDHIEGEIILDQLNSS